MDSSAAWQSTRRMVSANRDTLMAIAGVFFLLPALIAAVALPNPPLAHDLDQVQMADAVVRFYTAALPVMLPLSLLMLLGYLTMLVLLLDPDRPTVAQAIGQAARLLPGYLLAQVLVSVALGLVWVVVLAVLSVALAMVIGSALLPLAAGGLSMVVMIYPLIRIMLIGPEMVAGRRRNPLRAIAAGVARTRGHALGMLLYFGPAMTLFFVVYGLVVIAVSVAAAFIAAGETQRMIGLAVGGVLISAGYTYFTAMIAATYLQLGTAPDAGPDSPFRRSNSG